jgi:DNA (cytosine-5)-methyltransferase 1
MKQDGSHSRKKFTVGCLFAAIGGFCKAFELTGTHVVWANEKDKYAKETFEANFPHSGCLPQHMVSL